MVKLRMPLKLRIPQLFGKPFLNETQSKPIQRPWLQKHLLKDHGQEQMLATLLSRYHVLH